MRTTCRPIPTTTILNDMAQLADEHCVALTKQARRVSATECTELLALLPDWRVVEIGGIERLERQYPVPGFVRALSFTNNVGAAAEQEDHHPAILTEWGRVTVSWWTHTVRGLHRNDFVMAAQTDRIYARAAS
jgi:4a-hydroxytetrahydrobiopterin dehydratase